MTEPSTGFGQALRRCLMLGLAALAGWLVLALPSWWFYGSSGLTGLTIAATLCLIPGWLVFLLYSHYGTAAPLAVMLVATLGRMAFVMVGALVVKHWWPDFDMLFFALALGTFYVLTLTIETRLLFLPQHRGVSTDD